MTLHESWGVACATTEKQWCPVSTESTSSCFRGKAFLQANLHKAGCRKTLMSKEYTYACFGGQAIQGQTRNLNQSHLRRGKQGWGREKALNLSVSAPLTNCNVATCCALFIVLQQQQCVEEPYTPLTKFVLQWWPEWYGCQFGRLRPYFTKPTLQLSGCGAEKVACPADTLDKSRHKPGQQGPNGRSISLAKRTAQLPSLNLVNRMCLSNSDFDVQSVGYKSAQSPTNWESIHGKDPSILCWLSSRLSMALSNENPKGEIQDCALTKETCNNHVHAMYVKFGEGGTGHQYITSTTSAWRRLLFV